MGLNRNTFLTHSNFGFIFVGRFFHLRGYGTGKISILLPTLMPVKGSNFIIVNHINGYSSFVGQLVLTVEGEGME